MNIKPVNLKSDVKFDVPTNGCQTNLPESTKLKLSVSVAIDIIYFCTEFLICILFW